MALERGDLFVVASPSGGGKTTLIRRVLEGFAQEGVKAYFSISHTTRPPRPGERHGVDYYFVDRASFERMVDEGEFLEWAQVHGHLYGTSRRAVEEQLAAGSHVFLDIDVQGARQVRARVSEVVSVFILPPSREELLRRLRRRGGDSEDTIALRIRNALMEIRQWSEFDYVIINSCVEEAARTLASIVVAEGCRQSRMRDRAVAILADFEGGSKEG